MNALRAAGWANVAIGLLHLAGIPWERRLSYWVGIGPDMERLEHMHALLPALLWVATAAAFLAFGAYTLSVAGSVRSLPFAGPVVVGITWVYFLRAIGGSGMGGLIEDRGVQEVVFSGIALGVAVLYAAGLRSMWLR
jgi:hypothetical protein